MQMNWFDIVSATLILVIGLKGVFNGTIREFSGLLGIVAGVWLGSLYGHSLGLWIGDHVAAVDSPSALTMLGFLTLLVLSWSGFIVLGVLLSKRLGIALPKTPDRLFGFLFASAKVFIILAVIVFFLSRIEFVHKNAAPYVRGSLFYPLFLRSAETIVHYDAATAPSGAAGLEREAKRFLEKNASALPAQADKGER